MINARDLQHGDVILYDHNMRQSDPFVQLIHLITGTDYEHGTIIWYVDNISYVLEQYLERMHSLVKFYYNLPGEKTFAFRPTFPIPRQNDADMFRRSSYGYTTVLDGLLNRFMSHITLNHWEFRPILRKWFKSTTIDCFGLVALMLDLEHNTKWCKYASVVEGRDFVNHPEYFTPLGEIDWNQLS